MLLRRAVSAAILSIAFSAVTFAQGLASITGTVSDTSGAVIPGASIKAVETSTKSTYPASTNSAGIFDLPSVPPGSYIVEVSAQGFKAKRLENISLNSFQQLSLGNIVMTVGEGPASVITVEAEQDLVKDTGARYDTIQSKQISEMPNNGRNWATMLKVLPGSGALSDSAITGREYGYYGYADFSVNGKPASQTQVNLDGGSIVDHGSDAKVTVSPSLESIQEISVLTNNFTAEYGNRAGAAINIVTKSGTNGFHGVAFENLRNEAMNANSYSNVYNGLPKATYRYNYFGGNLGGPVKRNKIFFFYNVEDFKQNLPGSIVQARVPTDLEKAGDFSKTLNSNGTKPTIYMPGTQYFGTPTLVPNNVIPPSLINPLGAAILKLYPSPNNTADANNNYNLVYQSLYPRLSQSAKGDWNISDRTHIYGRYSNDSGTNTDKGIYNSSANLPFNLMNQFRPDRALAISGTHVLTPTLVVQGLFGWSYDFVQVTPLDPNAVDPSKLGLSNLPSTYKSPNSILPGINTGGLYPTFNFNRLPAYARANEFQYSSTLTWTKGTHIVKFGIQSFRNTKQEITSANDKGTYDFSPSHSTFDTNYGPANTLVGALNEYTQVSAQAHKDSTYTDVQLFLQDTWRLKSNLTIDYGVRLYHFPAEHDVNPSANLDGVFIPSLYNPAKAPRYYVPNPLNSKQVIDPANPNQPLDSAVASLLLYTLVPGSGDPLNGVVPLGSPQAGNAGLLAPKFLLIAPRGGFAYSPDFDKKMVIRGGFGWGYNRNGIGDAVTAFNNGLATNVDYLQTSLTTLAGGSNVSRQSAISLAARDNSSAKTPTIYDYSISVQRQLPFQMVIDLAYVGNLQRHQPINFNINAIAPGTAFKPQYVDSTNVGYNFYGPITASNPNPLPGSNTENALVMRPYQGFNTLTATTNSGNNRYDGFQLHLNKRFGHGLTFQLAYTRARLLSGTENVGLYNYNWKQYSGYVSGTNRDNTTAINYLYDLPKASKFLGNNFIARKALDDWQFGHLLNFFSGAPFSPSFSVLEASNSTSVSLGNVFLGTPDLTPRLGIGGSLASTTSGLYFNPSNLTVPSIFPTGTGTGDRNFLQGPATFTNDMSMTKRIKITEKKMFELRVNAYNVFNQVRHSGSGTVNSSVQYKANGATAAAGFYVYNTPDQVLARATVTGPVAQYNQYRTGVGYSNILAVLPMRILEVSAKFRF